MDNNWALRKTNWVKVKKIDYLGFKKKKRINKIGYFKMIPSKIYND